MADAGLSAGTLFGGYRIESFLARGGMGLVYKATQLALERTVALKLVAPELAHDEAFRERFKREALLAASLDHPNILPVYEAGEIDGQLFLAMRLVAGTDLDSVIRREHVLAPERAAAIVVQVAAALDAAHSRGLVHRDVKPGNVLIAAEYGEERAYLTDFGLTKSVATNAHLTRTGHMVGTLDYVAPEQAQGGKVDGRADTYALACLLFVTVTGQVPFDRPTDAAKLWAHLNDSPPSAAAVSPAVSPELDGVIQRGMAKRPEDRYASSGEFARAARDATVPQRAGRLDRTEIDPAALDRTEVEAPPAPRAPRAGADRTGTDGRSGRGTHGRSGTGTDRRSGTGTDGQSRLDRAFGSRRRAAYAAGTALVLIVGAVVALAGGGGGGGGGGKPSTSPARPTTPAAATSAVSTPTQPATTTSAADAQLTAYHAQVAQITPRINSFRLPHGRDFGKPVFSHTVLASAATLRGTADSLDALSPPPQLLTNHEALVAHLREMEQALRSLAVDSDNRNFSGARTDLNRLKAADAEVAAGVRAVQANGGG